MSVIGVYVDQRPQGPEAEAETETREWLRPCPPSLGSAKMPKEKIGVGPAPGQVAPVSRILCQDTCRAEGVPGGHVKCGPHPLSPCRPLETIKTH
ncbi:hypothetical protein NL676_021414 [Syzygium grande]|nr:hypothetical protein NL676_021414 [Syzygium grande]